MSALPGTVYLVGAGPGDPDLITVRGRELLTEADAVVVDSLASPRLLDLVQPGAEIHRAGKRAGRHSATQAEINQLLVRLARDGRSVIRLKGGDPFVFGRGGEECEALRDAGIPYEIVPGVTSAVAAPAAAGIPVTHRDWASHVTVVTGHEREDGDGDGGGRVDLRGLARLLPAGTLVFLMGARTLPAIVAGLLDGGADPQTPAAAIQWGTDPRQRTCLATLETIAGAVTAARLGAPMVTVVGRWPPDASWSPAPGPRRAASSSGCAASVPTRSSFLSSPWSRQPSRPTWRRRCGGSPNRTQAGATRSSPAPMPPGWSSTR